MMPRAISLYLVTRPEYEGNVASSMNRVRFIARSFTEASSPNVHAWPGKADRRILRRW